MRRLNLCMYWKCSYYVRMMYISVGDRKAFKCYVIVFCFLVINVKSKGRYAVLLSNC